MKIDIKIGKTFYAVCAFLALTVLFSWYFWKSATGDYKEPVSLKNVSQVAGMAATSGNQMAKNAPTGQQAGMSQAGTAMTPNSQISQSQGADSATAPDGNSDATTDPDASEEDNTDEKFESEILGISLNIPAGFKKEEKSGRLDISDSGKKVSIKVYDNTKKKELEDWYKSHFDGTGDSGCVFNNSTVKIGTLETKDAVINEETCQNGGLIAQNADKTRVIKADMSDIGDEDLKKIVSSITFLDKQ